MSRRPRLILASASPQRHALLKGLGVPFTVVPSRTSERTRQREPRRMVVELALRKARSVSRLHPEAAVLGADTIVYCRRKVIVKPRGRRDSESILRSLSGTWHRVYTGVAIVLGREGFSLTGCAVTRVKARRLSEEQVSCLTGKHMDKAGGYAVQDKEDPFIEKVEGDLDNVIGLPMRTVRGLWASLVRRRRAG